ncbi:hypothetical protein MKX03_019883, partial [Papaver bracteatum]
MNELASGVAASAAAVSLTSPGVVDQSADDSVRGFSRFTDSTSTDAVGEMKEKVSRPASLDVLNRVTFNNTLDTPRSTIKGMLKVNKSNEITYGRKNLHKVEQQLQQAFVELYSKLRLLKSF